MLWGALGVGLLENLLAGIGVKWSKIPGCIANIPGQGAMRVVEGMHRADEGPIRAGQDF